MRKKSTRETDRERHARVIAIIYDHLRIAAHGGRCLCAGLRVSITVSIGYSRCNDTRIAAAALLDEDGGVRPSSIIARRLGSVLSEIDPLASLQIFLRQPYRLRLRSSYCTIQGQSRVSRTITFLFGTYVVRV